MPNESELGGLDPFDLFDREAERIAERASRFGAADWERASRCPRWTARDVMAHLLATEEYHQACLDGRVKDYMKDMAERGATDIASGNDIGIAALADRTPEQLLAEWRRANADTRRRFRERGDGTVDTSIGDYPARWQAFHLATELATHADDMHIPVTDDEQQERMAWRGRFARFSLSEYKPDLEISRVGDRTRVRSPDGPETEVDDATLVEAVGGRLSEKAGLDPAVRRMLNITP